MVDFPLGQAPPSGPHPTMTRLSPRRMNAGVLALGYFVAFFAFHLGSALLELELPGMAWSGPAALSTGLLLSYGPRRRVLAMALAAPLPVCLAFPNRDLPALGWFLALAVLAGAGAGTTWLHRRLGFSGHLRHPKEVGALVLAAFIPPLAAGWPAIALLRALGGHENLRHLIMGHALGVLILTPALLVWVRPAVSLRGPLGMRAAGLPGRWEAAAQLLTLAVTTHLVVHGSDPGTLHLKYLFFLPMTWIAVRGGLRIASLAFPLLGLLLGLLLYPMPKAGQAVLGMLSFLLVLAGTTLFLAAAVDSHEAAERAQDRRRRRLNQLIEGTGAIPWSLDLATGRMGHLGRQAEAVFGWPLDRWRGAPFWADVILPEDQLAFLKFLTDVGRSAAGRQAEFRLREPGGGARWVRAVASLDAGGPAGWAMGFLFDIQAHKTREEHVLQASLKEKDLLLREIHHRVKNNLQVVSSLLRLQGAAQPDPATQRAFREAQERVQAIALIHQRLKHAPDFNQLDLGEYVRSLAERLVRSFASAPTLVDLHVEVGQVNLAPDSAVPLGLILNELITNALLHGFPPGQGGSLDIGLHQDQEGWVHLQVSDSGTGLPEGLTLEQGGLGFQLVQALTQQLGGRLDLERRRGAAFHLRFPSADLHP